MSYQVLARKYRPVTFADLEGQEHVLRALVNALEQQRLHHAYLFTGTRGVGKTTIARILARCFNCETGITATPCGECHSCREILEGRAVDLIEVDAASRTGVDDMRDLLDNVQYMPAVSRFKIYLIDEVHMLSKSSFNAMLKTLEEPPAHVKFLFATTDPKKLPITVLSRCLQFNLKNMTPEQIVRHLGEVLAKESIAFDEPALWLLGHAADGSMRDALSLTDQAISFGDGEVREQAVSSMLGSIDQQEVHELLDALIEEDGSRLLEKVAALSVFAPDYAALLDEMLSVLHRIAIAGAVPEAIDNSQGDKDRILTLARRLPPTHVQLLYQIGLIGQRDLPLAPMPRIGFEMVLLRMLSFAPDDKDMEASEPNETREASGTPKPAPANRAKSSPVTNLLSAIQGDRPEEPTIQAPQSPDRPVSVKSAPGPKAVAAAAILATTPVPALEPEHWPEIVALMSLSGVTGSLAANCQLEAVAGQLCRLKLEEHHASLWNEGHEHRIAEALSGLYNRQLQVAIEVGATDRDTPAQLAAREREEKQARAVADLESDQRVRSLIENFNGRLDHSSIAPAGGTGH